MELPLYPHHFQTHPRSFIRQFKLGSNDLVIEACKTNQKTYHLHPHRRKIEKDLQGFLSCSSLQSL